MSKATDHKPEPPTTGHVWDGIREYDNPMPRWWLWTFYASILFAVIWIILYPALPLVSGSSAGLLGWSSRQQVNDEIQAMNEANAVIDQQLASVELTAIDEDNPELYQYAVNAGGAIFRTWCAQCHGSGAAGAVGFPNLLDDDWLWGGTIEDIHYTISHGIRNEDDPDARYSEMPAFGEILSGEEIDQVVNYVMSLSGEAANPEVVAAGEQVFLDNCAACHGDDAHGDPSVGAPDLTDAIWLYGGDYETLRNTVTNSRFGVMPAWSDRLSESDIRAAATYVHQLGGGEGAETSAE